MWVLRPRVRTKDAHQIEFFKRSRVDTELFMFEVTVREGTGDQRVLAFANYFANSSKSKMFLTFIPRCQGYTRGYDEGAADSGHC